MRGVHKFYKSYTGLHEWNRTHNLPRTEITENFYSAVCVFAIGILYISKVANFKKVFRILKTYTLQKAEEKFRDI